MSEFISSTTNYLLTRDDVGRPKPATRRLPSFDYAYGRPPMKDQEGVREVLGNWKFHNPSELQKPGRDFTKLNKISLAAGVTNPKSHFHFRNSVDPRVNLKTGSLRLRYYLPEEQFSYGVPNRPSTPIKQVIGGDYGNNSAMMTEELYKLRLEEKRKERENKFVPKSTKTNELLYSTAKERLKAISRGPAQESFKIKKYLNVSCRTEHVNSEYIRTRSQMNSEKSYIQKLPSIRNGNKTSDMISVTENQAL